MRWSNARLSTVSTEKLRIAFLYENVAYKMFMKLTPKDQVRENGLE